MAVQGQRAYNIWEELKMETTIVRIMNGFIAITPTEEGNHIWYSESLEGINERLGRVYPERHEPKEKKQKKVSLPPLEEEEY